MPGPVMDILMITCNRPRYTELALDRLLATCTRGVRVWIWHNGPPNDTLKVVTKFGGHPAVTQVHVSGENRGLREPTIWFWKHAEAALVSKVDDDCLLPDGWAGILADAHRCSGELGLVGCWPFYDEDFVPELAVRKIRGLPGGHRIMANCFLGGSGYVMKKAVIEDLGPVRPTESFTSYGVRAAACGWLNGWYFPFLHMEHMDDPRSPYFEYQTDEEFLEHRPLSAVQDNVRSIAEWRNKSRWTARSVQRAPYDPYHFIGWRGHVRRGVARLKHMAGVREPWRIPGIAELRTP